MANIKPLIILSLGFMIVLVSCKKTSNTVDTDCRLKQITYNSTVSYIVSYTASNISEFYNPGHITELTYDTLGYLGRKVIYYNGALGETHTYINSGLQGYRRLEIDSTNFLSGYLQLVGNMTYNYYGNGGCNAASSYCGRGDLYSTTSVDPNVYFQNINYTWVNGDPTIVTMSIPNSSQIITDSITYDTTKINMFNQLFPQFGYQITSNDLVDDLDKYMLYHFLSKHVITKVTSTGGDYKKAIGNFTYTYNEKGLISQMLLNGQVLISYNYTCD